MASGMMVRECELVYRQRESTLSTTKITSSESVYRLMGPYVNRAHESIWVVMLQARQRVVGIHECARGSVSTVPASVSTVFRAAVVSGAAAVIVVHNHPSDDPQPSAEDVEFTKRVVAAGELLGVVVLDHVIIAQSGYYSMLDAGEMKVPVSP